MAIFLTTRGATSELEKIINSASQYIVLVSPFIRIPDSLFQNLRAADQRNLSIWIVHGKSQLEREILKRLKELKNVKLYFLENLHAKCYFNEKSMVITSLNLYDYSEQNNREMGVLVTKQDDEAVYNEASQEVKMIIDLATRLDFNTQLAEVTNKQAQPKKPVKKESIWTKDLSEVFFSFFGNNKKGFCIGCRTKIDFDEYKPYCPDCYAIWKQNKWQKAQYCHNCGEQFTTSIKKPVCRSCWKKIK